MDSPWLVASPFGASPVPHGVHTAPHLEVWGMGVLLKRRGSVIPKALVWSLPCAIITAARRPHSMASRTKMEVPQDGWIWMANFPISMEGLVAYFPGDFPLWQIQVPWRNNFSQSSPTSLAEVLLHQSVEGEKDPTWVLGWNVPNSSCKYDHLQIDGNLKPKTVAKRLSPVSDGIRSHTEHAT